MTTARKRSRTLAGRIAVRCGLARVARFHSDQSGATAVEFSLVALPFIAIMFAIIETALTFFAGQALETAVSNSARLIRTGQAQEQSFDAAEFKDKICDQVFELFNCEAGLRLDVRKFSSFDTIDLSWPLNPDGTLKTDGYVFEPGNGGDIVVVRAFYEWPVIVNQLGTNLSNVGSGKHLLAATAAFRNEPFPW